MQKVLFIIIILLGSFTAAGQKLWHKQGHSHACPVCYGSKVSEKVFIPPPSHADFSLKSAEKKSEFIVSYSLFPQEAKNAFEYAVSIWEQLIESPVPIYVQANWRTKSENVLGSCAPTGFERNFSGAPRKNIYYPIALAEKITGTELTGANRADMVAEFNKDIDWYFGTDGKTPALLYDFVSVVLHEIGHGLGFTGFFYVDGQMGEYSWFELGDATSFDNLVVRFNGDQLIDTSIYTNPSTQLKDALVSNLLYANSPVVLSEESNRPRLYAPSEWDNGSSLYHLNGASYPSTNINSLMTQSIGRGTAIHNPGPLTMGILADLGWKNTWIDLTPVKDREEISPVKVEVRLTSDYPLDTTQLYVIYSVDSFSTQPDSLPLLETGSGIFEAEWLPKPETQILNYYISVRDSKNRYFRNPSEAPNEFLSVSFGPDNKLPEIIHEPISFFFDTGNKLIFTALVDDNLGVDTVYVEYSVNDIEQPSFGLKSDSGMVYTGIFPIENEMLDDGDEIKYQIVATDISTAKNTRKIPLRSTYTFKVEKMFEPVGSYFIDFNNATTDFVLSDFDVFTDEGFENGALHSPHPYPSPDKDDAEFNFVTLLKYPIVLDDRAIMSFDEIVLVEPGTDGTTYGDFEFWDYVIVEGSKDKGKSWLPLADGYDSRENSSWENKFYSAVSGMNSTAAGSPDLFINKQVSMTENGNFSTGDTIIIRFRLFSDPYAHGWGWAIDNLKIQSPVSATQTVLSPGNLLVYPNPFTGSFHVSTESKKTIETLEFEVYNMFGQKIKSVIQKNVTGTVTVEIEIENGVSGFYFLVVKENGKQVLTKKIIHN
jgi:hypothetical protein